jgi:septum formation protein|tara:strand:- start:10866 stop:11441 length:576 start_codon:yes stop_codon:yes gene_type:complete
MKIVLASSSPSRRKILKNAGIDFLVTKPLITENKEKKKYKGPPKKLALYLAEKKALSIKTQKDTIVVGADQVLFFQGKVFDKPRSINEAKKHLLLLSGKTHNLVCGTVIAKNDRIVWKHTEECKMTMHKLEKNYLDHYLKLTGKKILKSVGAYTVEGCGVRLFRKIDGDFFSIVGLPLIPLLNEIRKLEKK